MIITSEYIFPNPKFDELNDIMKNTRLEHDKNYDHMIIIVEKLRLDVTLNILIKQKTKQKILRLNIHLHFGTKKTKIASRGTYEKN